MAMTSRAALFKQRSELLDFLLEVSEVSSETLDLEKLLPALAKLVKKVIDYEIFAILLVGEGGLMRMRFSIGHREEVVQRLRIPIGEWITGAAAATRRPVLVNDVRKDPRYLNALDAVRSELAVPMVARGKVVGVIDIQSTRLAAFTEQEEGIVELIAARTAMAIDNARLYRRVVKQNRTLRTLTAIAQEFSSILEVDPLLRKLAEQLRQLITYDALSILLLEPDEAMLKDYLSIRYDQRVHLDNIPLGQGIVGAAAGSKQPVLVPDTGKDPRYIACSVGIRSEVAVPLLVGSRLIGVIDLESEHLNFFTEDHVRTLSLLAPQVATAIENARLYQRVARNEARLEADLEAARQLQQHLLPGCCPRVEGLEIAARCEPARQIGGDLYDFFTFSDRRPGMVVGDVSGKGAAAALYASLVTGQLRLLAPEHPSPASLLCALNRALLDTKTESSYLTLVCAQWHADSQTLVVANAGMPLPILLSLGKAAEQHVVGIPLGLLGDTQYEEVSLPLQPGDAVVFASDGIIDNRDHAGEDYGRDRLARLIERHGRRPAGELLQRIFHDVEKHAAGRRAFDDQTAVVVKRTL
ncbi:MAG: SpoIIE family protein phosphatase [Acidobacteria bacterium]|nr:SpoIIE family protein phosphatase [Acidobacteriota bacterium]